MKILTNYNEIITMFYLSKLIYDYHENDSFDLNINETIFNYVKRINNDFENGLHNIVFINIKNALLFLSNNYPKSIFQDFISNDKTDIQVGIILSNNNICIVFKGTDSLIDCYYDLNFMKRNIDTSNIEIHKGFFQQIMSIYNELLNSIQKLLQKNPDLYIYITGHSAGAAQGTIFAYLISKVFNNKLIKLITFGGPKVGNYEWFTAFNKIQNIIHYRITNEGDIITKVPNFEYYHVGINLHLTTNNIHIFKEPICCSKEYCMKEWCNNYDDELIDNPNNCIFYNLLSKFNYLNIYNHNIHNYYINLINKQEIINDICDRRQLSSF